MAARIGITPPTNPSQKKGSSRWRLVTMDRLLIRITSEGSSRRAGSATISCQPMSCWRFFLASEKTQPMSPMAMKVKRKTPQSYHQFMSLVAKVICCPGMTNLLFDFLLATDYSPSFD